MAHKEILFDASRESYMSVSKPGGMALTMTMTPWNLPNDQLSKSLTSTTDILFWIQPLALPGASMVIVAIS